MPIDSHLTKLLSAADCALQWKMFENKKKLPGRKSLTVQAERLETKPKQTGNYSLLKLIAIFQS